ncbi:MAG: sarcosine oxidase subunit alpha family protein, partial [Alphaproteobacteria bacterium]|nr:sarcosine oxidase subunit alpha family protein [Alphaproteobacteria bacterium]
MQLMRSAKGGHLDRDQSLSFRFNGHDYEGFSGDSLASALLANGVRLVGRSLKYHRPRGVMTNGPEEPSAMVQLESGAFSQPNILATMLPLYDGLEARSQNCWPNVHFDLLSVNQMFAAMLPAGFYYKTFMWPKDWWMHYEKWIRRSAGLGVASQQPDPDHYTHVHEHTDMLVIGAGTAGLSAALAAARMGAKVTLADERTTLGGSLLNEPAATVADEEIAVRIDELNPKEWVDHTLAELRSMSNVRILPATTITYYGHQNYLVGAQRLNENRKPGGQKLRQVLWRIRAKQVVLATGAIERGPVFGNNDRPGIMTSSALRGYVNHYAVNPGRSICLFTNNDSAYRTALDLVRIGCNVQIVDCRTTTKSLDARLALQRGVVVQMNGAITSVLGSTQAREAHSCQMNPDGSLDWHSRRVIPADVLAVSSGWTPTVHLWSQAKGTLRFRDDLQGYVPDTISCTTIAAGSCNGDITLSECLKSGHEAGIAVATALGLESAKPPKPTIHAPNTDHEQTLQPMFLIPKDKHAPLGTKRFVDIQNDSTASDLALAQREGFRSIELVKRYTTTGMGIDQGKLGNMNAIGILADSADKTIPEIGVTTYRPPYTPVSFGVLGGASRKHLFEQERPTPMHAWHVDLGAVFEDVGDWKRARYYPRGGEDMYAAVQRESRAVRTTCGIFDGSTLGKIDLQGSDCVKLLNMLYTNAWDKLAVGHCRYGVMLNEHGMIFDDGVTTRLDTHHYHMTTTTGGAAGVMGWIEEMLQTEWHDWQVHTTSVTDQWAVVALNGPKAREILQPLTDTAIDAESLPFMAYTKANIAGIPARIFRISFTGEVAFEINVPARFGYALWKALIVAGKPHDLTPYGTESMHLLRAEKGFIIVGQDTDGTVTPSDAGLDWVISQKKTDFLGKRSLRRSDSAREDRKQLVGLATVDGKTVLPEGSHLIESSTVHAPMTALGHITSSYYSPILKQPIALAMIRSGRSRIGQTAYAVDPKTKTTTAMTICDAVFYDKEGSKALPETMPPRDLPCDTPTTMPPPEITLPLTDRQHQVDGVTLSVPTPRFLITLRGNQVDPAFKNWFKTYFDADCPNVSYTHRNGFCVYWQGPDQLQLCFKDEGLARSWFSKLHNQRLKTPLISLVEVSDHFCFIRL